MTHSTTESTVLALIEAAGLTLSEEEIAGFVNAYPVLRAQADSLYAVFDGREDLDDVTPAFDFSAAFATDGSAPR